MIAKLPKGRKDGVSSFRDLVRYCLGVTGHEQGTVLHVGSQNLLNDTEEAYKEMEDLASQNTRCKVPAMHFILSWRSEESPTNEQVDEAVGIALKELNLEDCQALWALQDDTENLHVHVVVNRISLETYRPVRSNGGWTKKALEKAARKIEIVQGWEVEKSGRYAVDEMGNVSEKVCAVRVMPEVSQTARDIEAHTGCESFERVAKREIASVLESAESWEELHIKLAKKGYQIERKGKGGVLKKGGQALKLSHVSRSSSFSKLEQRLGKYEEHGSEIKISEPSESEPKALPCTTQWEEYQRERDKYFESKKSAIKDLKSEQKEERERLHELQRSRWRELHSESWKGRRDELNQLRCLIAYAHKKEQLNLRDAQREEMEEVKSRYPRRFPSYKEWLSQNRAGQYCRNLEYVMMKPLQSPTPLVESSRGIDLRSYDARRGAGSSVLYCRSGTYTADFSDMGSRIVLNKRRLTEETVLSALQLANAKWGATEITGNDEYKKLCVLLAVKHGLKLANPELSAEVERRKQEQCQLFHRYSGITADEISQLNLADDPRIYVNPRTDNQQYKGRLVHIDEGRGYCVQLVGQRSLFVHRLACLETVPRVGDKLKISYVDGSEKARVQPYDEQYQVRSL